MTRARPYTDAELDALGLPSPKFTEEEAETKAADLRLQAVEMEKHGRLIAAMGLRRQASQVEAQT